MSSDPFSRPYCPAAWRAEPFSYYNVSWQLEGEHVDPAAARLLLERAQLPALELLHMGAPAWLLTEPNPRRAVALAELVPVLGRVVWDAERGTDGAVWSDTDLCARLAVDLKGKAVVARYFS